MPTQAPKISYTSFSFSTVRQTLVTYLQAFYANQWQDFNVASVGSAIIDLNAYISDLLSYSIDKKFNSLFIDGLQDLSSAYRMAKTFGYKVPGNRPSVTLVDLIINVPVGGNGSQPDPNYLPFIQPGLQVKGAGQIFETLDEVDFSSDFSGEGIANRVINPILNGTQSVVSYQIIKREKVEAGSTKIYQTQVLSAQAVPFYELTLPDTNVLEIISVIVYAGQLNIINAPSFQDFNNPSLQYYEVDYLPTNEIFTNLGANQNDGNKPIGDFIKVSQRFEKTFNADGTCSLTFGGGTPNYNAYQQYLNNIQNNITNPINNLNISGVLQNDALGVVIQPNSTVFVKYRVGGGIVSNIGSGILNSVSNINATVDGSNPVTTQNVISSLRANNPIPANGGSPSPSVQEIQMNIAGFFASQNRACTIDDYISIVQTIPGEFASPYRVHGAVGDNKIKLYILTLDSNNNFSSNNSSTVLNNIVNFLAPYRMINDFVEVNNGFVICIIVQAKLFVDKTYNSNEIKQNVITAIQNFFTPSNWNFNEPLYFSDLTGIMLSVPGVLNVVQVNLQQAVGGPYSSYISPQADLGSGVLSNNGSTTIYNLILQNNALYSDPTSIITMYFPSMDIQVATG